MKYKPGVFVALVQLWSMFTIIFFSNYIFIKDLVFILQRLKTQFFRKNIHCNEEGGWEGGWFIVVFFPTICYAVLLVDQKGICYIRALITKISITSGLFSIHFVILGLKNVQHITGISSQKVITSWGSDGKF